MANQNEALEHGRSLETSMVIFNLDDHDEEVTKKNTVAAAAKPTSDLAYGIDDVPPWYLCMFLGLQVKYNTIFKLMVFAHYYRY